MTDVQDANSAAEPSMEEILASIRRIIADEKEEPAAEEVVVEEAASTEDVLELTQAVEEDGSVVTVESSEIEMAPMPEPPPVNPKKTLVKEEADELLSNIAASAAASSLESLASTVQNERKVTGMPFGDPGRTLEDMVMELMRPMLKQWLDENLPSLVERIVQKEVERIARRVQD